jgi:2-dehydropantoate 2-reductase
MEGNMKIAIIGAGAMGSLLGFYLSQVAEVWLLAHWAEHIAAINNHGISCERDGRVQVQPCHATSDPGEIGSYDVALVLTKAAQTPWAAEQLLIADDQTTNNNTGLPSSVVGRRSSLVYTLQNGIGNRELLAASLGEGRVGQGVTALGATLLGPGRVRHAGMGPTVFGSAPDPEQAGALANLFIESGLPAETSTDLESLVWGKLMANVAINALTALLRVPNGALAAVPGIWQLAEAAVGEAAAIAAARGTVLPYTDPLAHALSIATATGANHSSMLQDVLRGAPTEIATINGAICREGRRLRVATPVNDMLTALVEGLDATRGERVGFERLSQQNTAG